MFSRKRITKALIRRRFSAGWSAPLLFTCNNVCFSYVDIHINGDFHHYCNNMYGRIFMDKYENRYYLGQSVRILHISTIDVMKA